MKILVTVKSNSKEDAIEQINNNEYKIRVKAPPIDGRANEALKKILSRHLKISKSLITIKSGNNSKKKIIEIHTI